MFRPAVPRHPPEQKCHPGGEPPPSRCEYSAGADAAAVGECIQ